MPTDTPTPSGSDAVREALHSLLMMLQARPDMARLMGFAEKAVYENARSVHNAALTRPSPDVEMMREALTKCRDKFREYEQMHLAKVRPHIQGVHWSAKIAGENKAARAKADRNREMADMCDDALSALGGDRLPTKDGRPASGQPAGAPTGLSPQAVSGKAAHQAQGRY